MKLLIMGATGMVGKEVVKQGLQRGHEITAVARNALDTVSEDPNLTTVAADILVPDAIAPLTEGVDAVISTVGIGTSKVPTLIYSEGARNLLSGMAQHGVARIVLVSSEVADHWAHQNLFKLWFLFPVLQRFLGASYDDMRRMDTVLWESDSRWTTVRAPRIRNKSGIGDYRLDTGKSLPRGLSITAADIATALLDIASRSDLDRRFAFVAN